MKKPILVLKCAKCGTNYAACVLAYGVNEDFSNEIKNAVAAGDEIYVTESVKLGVCECV